MTAATELSADVGVRQACEALSVPRSSYYRALRPAAGPPKTRQSRRALGATEKEEVRTVLCSERFADEPPRQVYATLLDQGRYLCHWRTMYRILAEKGQTRERRNQRQHPVYEKPELLATAPLELWSWDITKMRGPQKWVYYYLYVIMDVFSRFVVGYMVAPAERSMLARELIETTCRRQGIDRNQLTIHADRGAPMTSKTVAQLLVELGVEKTHSRPHVSNDNPFSEAHFKTMKYRPDYPKRFGSLEDARAWARDFFEWYNHIHHHSALGLMPPAVVHYGQADLLRRRRAQVLRAAYEAHPERFPRGMPRLAPLPEAVWINKPNQAVVVEAPSLGGDGQAIDDDAILTVNREPSLRRAPELEPRA